LPWTNDSRLGMKKAKLAFNQTPNERILRRQGNPSVLGNSHSIWTLL